MTCTVDQDVRLTSVYFERDEITQIMISEAESHNCSILKFQKDSHNYTSVCYLSRNFTLIKHDVNQEDHNKTWRCSMLSILGGPCTILNPCISNNTIAVLQDEPIVQLRAEVRDINPFRLKEGHTNVVLMCEVVIAYPEIILFIWTHNGIEVQNESRSNLTIHGTTREINGTWGCRGINNYGTPVESHLQIDVQCKADTISYKLSVYHCAMCDIVNVYLVSDLLSNLSQLKMQMI
ncbi:hypothetical protein ACJMK2_027431 [Sinanodonta woodiana]|uniref:Ig-like domain-containing protein n=1 Tax=Sinanodonta woodiana TaxID=1069815 RepID=A0ABD3XP91_SINWO